MASVDTLSGAVVKGTDMYNEAKEAKKAKKAKDGGSIKAEHGGVTPDEFNHDSNPIDLVQDGEKIGEATGGELILPPDDVKAIEEALSNEDKDAAFELMKALVEKYKENEMTQSKEEEPKEAKGGGYLGRFKSKMSSLVKSSIKY